MQYMLWWIGDSHCPYNSGISTPQVRLLRAKTANKLTQELEEYTRHSMDHGPWTVGSRLQSQALSTQIETSNDPQNPQSPSCMRLNARFKQKDLSLKPKVAFLAQEPPSLSNLHLTSGAELLETQKGGRGAELTSGARTRIPPARRGGAPPAAARIAGSRWADEVDARSWPLEAEKIPSQSPQGLECSKASPSSPSSSFDWEVRVSVSRIHSHPRAKIKRPGPYLVIKFKIPNLSYRLSKENLTCMKY